MESVPSIGILSAKSGKIHFTPIAIITAKAVVTKHIALQDRNSQMPKSEYNSLATILCKKKGMISNAYQNPTSL
jgi:hypothetical protein